MMIQTIFDSAWNEISKQLDTICRPLTPEDWMISIKNYPTFSFPMRGYASLLKDRSSDEIFVISVDVRMDGTTITMTSDISNGAGKLFAEGPVAEVDCQSEDLREHIDAWVRCTNRFLAENQAILESSIESAQSTDSQ